MSTFLAILTLLFLPGPDWSECYEDTFCIEAEDVGNRVDVYVRSLVPWDFTMTLNMDLENMRPTEDLPLVDSYRGNSRTRAVSLSVRDIGRSWTFRFDLQWVNGDFRARHDEGVVYDLPFGSGVDYLVGQGAYGSLSHQGKYALDWDMPEGTPIRAARSGIVIEVQEGYTEGGIDPALRSRANFIKIRHSDGTIGHYVHLRHLGVEVDLGDRVFTGQLIGYSGNTGFSTGPHLHFEVFSATRELSRRTIPVRFRTASRGVTTLEEGHYYRR
ncbi:MAG: M23 family metallopeptidase [Bacteroidetes bacterium]|nr:M23 family metallopeptidase [Bacteroidota bacterium]MDA0874043.1 M23 family metallopeptidase [Bacteroidota bacterium]